MKPSYLATTLAISPKTFAHDLLYFFGIELLRHGGVARDVGEEDGGLFALGGGGGAKDQSRRFRLRRVSGLSQNLAASVTELAIRWIRLPTDRAGNFHLLAAPITKIGVFKIFTPAFWTYHFLTLPNDQLDCYR